MQHAATRYVLTLSQDPLIRIFSSPDPFTLS